MSAYAIRLAHAGDLPHLAAIERAAAALFAPYGFAEQFAAETTPLEDLALAARQSRLWVAVGGGDVLAGFALCRELDGSAHLLEIDVHPDHGRRGVGRALVAEVTRWAHRSRLPAVTLTTFRDVPWNAPFYERLGFRVLEADELPEALRDVLRHEAARGLPADRRVAMRKPVA
jgi:GNAT superfamily N-acetyltransferase